MSCPIIAIDEKERVWKSNLTGSPGYNSIISLFYKAHWNLVRELLHEVVLEHFRRKTLTGSPPVGLIAFCRKPKKGKSIKPKDYKRPSLLNTDYKIYSDIPACHINKCAKTALSSNLWRRMQYRSFDLSTAAGLDCPLRH